MVVDSPPGSTRPSSPSRCSSRRTRSGRPPTRGQHPQVLEHVALQRQHPDPGAVAVDVPVGAGWAARPAAPPAPRHSGGQPPGPPGPVAGALGHQPRSAYRSDAGRSEMLIPTMASPRPRDTLATTPGVVEVGRRLDDRAGPGLGVAGLEDARADEHTVRTQLHHHRGVRGRGDPTRGEQHDRQAPELGDLAHELDRRLVLLGRLVEARLVEGAQAPDLAGDGAHVARGLHDVAGAGLALGADHRRALRQAPQRLAEVGGAAHERDVEGPLVDVVRLVGRGQDLGLVDVVHAERLDDLRLDEVADAGLGHHRDRDRLDDPVDHVGVAHAGDAALGADVGRDALQRHHGDRTRLLGDAGLLGVHDVHDDAALEHVGHAALDAGRAPGTLSRCRWSAHSRRVSCPLAAGGPWTGRSG